MNRSNNVLFFVKTVAVCWALALTLVLTDPWSVSAQQEKQAEASKTESAPAKKEAPPVAATDKPAVEKSPADKSAGSDPAKQTKPSPAAPAVPESPKNAAEQRLIEKAQKQAAKAVRVPRKEAPRQMHIEKPGAFRRPVPRFYTAVEEKFQVVDTKKFEQIQKGKAKLERKIIDDVAKYHIYRMTQRDKEAEIPTRNEEILRYIRTCRGGPESNPPSSPVEFVRAYKLSLFKYLQEDKILLTNGIPVKLNALILAKELFEAGDEKNPAVNVPEGATVFVKTLKSDTQEDGMYLLACKGMSQAHEVGGSKVEQEREAVDAMLKLAERPDVQYLLMEQYAKTFGDLGLPSGRATLSRAEVASWLGKKILDRKVPARVKPEATISLAKMQTRDVAGWNRDLHAVLLGKGVVELVRGFNDGKYREQQFKYYAFQLGREIQKIRFSPVGTAASMVELFDLSVVPILGQVVNEEFNVSTLDIEDWINKKSIRDRKLAQQAEELKLNEPVENPANSADKEIK